MNILTFDIETVPDVELGRRLLNAPAALDDAAVAEAMESRLTPREGGGSAFLPPHQHRVVAISCALRSGESFKLWSLGEPDAPEADLVQRFFDGLERLGPTLVSWNGRGFDLPVLGYRALRHGVAAPRYWEQGDHDPGYRWNNYVSRFHWRHVDLMDVLGGYQGRGWARLDEVARLLGLPGKLGGSGESVWSWFLRGERERIRNYCELDVLNTYLIYLRFEVFRGRLAPAVLQQEHALVRETLQSSGKAHHAEFLAAWP